MPPFCLTTRQSLYKHSLYPVNKMQQLNTLFLQHSNSLETHLHRSTPVQLERGMEIKTTYKKVSSEKVQNDVQDTLLISATDLTQETFVIELSAS